MKKLSVLIALALCITIGGVYAAWTYATGVIDPVTKTATVNMEVEKSDTENGTLEVSFNPSYVIEPNYEVNPTTYEDANKYTPVLVDNSSSDLVITFKANEEAESTVKTNGITLKITIASSNFGKYENSTVISVNKEITVTGVDASNWSYDEDTETFTYTLSSAKLLEMIDVLDDYQLDTHEKATNFQNAVKTGTITITVTPTN